MPAREPAIEGGARREAEDRRGGRPMGVEEQERGARTSSKCFPAPSRVDGFLADLTTTNNGKGRRRKRRPSAIPKREFREAGRCQKGSDCKVLA
ncbi:hypothetical protein MUK42_06975 [Musa troglodytarum]|uniref:Uncharacterized protein n=1 Tax=Musa troglodytarum TaxID=320322 RepID=A0A9E7JG46_9LILI|nr:hypothetical protein MUK42_06975 [Musa troglodytarum]